MMKVQIPPAGLIEMARDSLKQVSPADFDRQHKELHVAIGDHPKDFIDGYDLGLQTARILMRQAAPGAHPADLL